MDISASKDEIKYWASEQVEFYGLDLTRISAVLILQIYNLLMSRSLSPHDIVSSIRVVEGLQMSNGTPDPEMFSRPPLKGLYKKHFPSPTFMVKNLVNFHSSSFGKAFIERSWQAAEEKSPSNDEHIINRVIHDSVMGAIEARSSAGLYTGEWIVFHKHKDRNYYLTLGLHTEDSVGIFERAQLACEFDDFPFHL